MNPLEVIRVYLLMSFQGAPLLLTGFTGIMSLGLANLGMFMLFLAQAIVLPLLNASLHLGHSFILGEKNPLIAVPASDVCQLIPVIPAAGTYTTVAPSIWVSQIMLFMTYLFYNANSIYGMPSETGADPARVENRKSRATSVMIITAVASIALIALRLSVSKGCETIYGAGLGVLIGTGVGIAWYEVAKACGISHADVFGIVAKMLPAGALAPPPKMCVYNQPT